MPNMLKPMVALLVVTLVASFLLGLVFTVTEEPIAAQKAQTEMEAITAIMEGTEVTDEVALETVSDSETPGTITKITRCMSGGSEVLGYVLSVSPKGYGGSIDIMVGISGGPVGTIKGVEIISHAETPGLGANADTPEFTSQYDEKQSSVLNVVKLGPAEEDEILAIASATITTQAVTNGVNEALAYYHAYLLGVEG